MHTVYKIIVTINRAVIIARPLAVGINPVQFEHVVTNTVTTVLIFCLI